MSSLDVLKKLYKPYRYTIKGKAMVLETTSGEFIIKEKNKDLNELYNYLLSRGFDAFPKLIDSSRSEVNLLEYVEDTKMPKEQRFDDLIGTIALLHSKTSYYKEVSEDKYKAIYDDINSNIEYLKNYYSSLYDNGFKEVYMSPSTYAFMRNYSKINNALRFCSQHLDEWYNTVEDKKKTRVAIVHNNLALEHFLENDKNYLISWDNYLIDTPILDIVKLYRKEYMNVDFSSALAKYLKMYPLLDSERNLLFVMLAMPFQNIETDKEFNRCIEINKVLNYVFKTEELIRPYYTEEEKVE